MQPRLNIALKACRSASDILLRLYKAKDQDELRSSEKINELLYIHIVNIISESYPLGENDILGPTYIKLKQISDFKEEYFQDNVSNNEEKFVWVINPLDSYENFANKLPLYNITITIFQNNEAMAALIYNPILDELITAIKGEGAMNENNKIRNNNLSANKMLYIIKDNKLKLNFESIIDGQSRNIGSKSTELVYLSEGKIDLFIDTDIEIWDSAAGVLICKESGVMITDQKGDDNIFESKSIVGAKDWLHQKIIKKLTY